MRARRPAPGGPDGGGCAGAVDRAGLICRRPGLDARDGVVGELLGDGAGAGNGGRRGARSAAACRRGTIAPLS